MGVHGTWLFLKEKGIHGFKVTDAKNIGKVLGDNYTGKTIHVDVVGALYDVIRDNFMTLSDRIEDEKSTLLAASKVINYASTVVDKTNSILYFDGNPTVERTFGYTNSTYRKLENQNNLEIVISKYLEDPNYRDFESISKNISKLFFIRSEIKSILKKVALKKGWNIFTAIGEAEVEIGIRGGIVMSNDSDMLYYPKIEAVIKPEFPGVFQVYRKASILKSLELTNEAFTALGIIPTNDYDTFHYPHPINKNSGSQYKQIYQDIFYTIKQIQTALQKYPYMHNIISVKPTVKEYLECFVSHMNAKYATRNKNQTKTIDIYQNSYNIFVLQRQQILPKVHDFREDAVKYPYYFFNKIHANSTWSF